MTVTRKISVKEGYFIWLRDLVEGEPDHKLTKFIHSLHQKEFKSIFPNDDNRAEDGKKLREDYFYGVLEVDYPVWNDPCTILEMMIALAKRIEYIMADDLEDQTAMWFWEMVENLGLEAFENDDPNIDYKKHMNDQILNSFQERKYQRNGRGGLFPLKRTKLDQREVELWYQMQAYIQECCPD
jgi:hypothetical protein